MREVEVRGHMIRLGQLLKLAGIADSGTEAKAMLAEGLVTVNGEREERRGRQLHPGDEVVAGDKAVRVTQGGRSVVGDAPVAREAARGPRDDPAAQVVRVEAGASER